MGDDHKNPGTAGRPTAPGGGGLVIPDILQVEIPAHISHSSTLDSGLSPLEDLLLDVFEALFVA